MRFGGTGCGGGRGGASHINWARDSVLERAEGLFDPAIQEMPRAHIFGFFLAPDDLACLGIACQFLFQLIGGEGVELLDTDKRDIRDLAFFARGEQIVIDLAAAQNDATNLLVVRQLGRFGDDAEEG